MRYLANVAVDFPFARHQVYAALCDLSRYPEWNLGMTYISHSGKMHQGLTYTTVVNVMGRDNRSDITVLTLLPDERIVLECNNGLVTFQATFELSEITSGSCSVSCKLRFNFNRKLFNLAQPVAEAIAETRIRADLETLSMLLTS